MSRYIDSHCHLDFPLLADSLEDELSACQTELIDQFIVPAVAKKSWQKLLVLGEVYDQIHVALGLHPCFLEEHKNEHHSELANLVASHNVVAVGECGLDLHIPDPCLDKQIVHLDFQLQLAKEFSLPVIMHVRKAHDQVLKMLRKAVLPKAGVIHAYSGSEQQAYQYIDLGFKLGFGGAVSFDRAKKTRFLAASLPLESLLFETDSPDMPPAFLNKGEANRPRYLASIAKIIVGLRKEPEQVVISQVRKNTEDLFSLRS